MRIVFNLRVPPWSPALEVLFATPLCGYSIPSLNLDREPLHPDSIPISGIGCLKILDVCLRLIARLELLLCSRDINGLGHVFILNLSAMDDGGQETCSELSRSCKPGKITMTASHA